MIPALLVAHVLTTVVIAVSGTRLGRGVFYLAVLPTGATAVYSLIALVDDRRDSWTIEWAPDLDLVLTLEMSPVAGMLSLLVSGIGALVMIYAAGYFSAGAAAVGIGDSLFGKSALQERDEQAIHQSVKGYLQQLPA